ncbi:MAG: D-alanine--D-alanine ligase [Actinomycetota bacterium]|nr:D-alanine--D-alanine ligase [Actinomycetota bacterium]
MTGGRRLRVALVFGGRSAEHEVSVASASSVLRALDPGRYDVVPVGIDRQGRWHLLPGAPALPPGRDVLLYFSATEGQPVTLARDPGTRALVREDGAAEPIDVVFPLLHGPFGEDGTIQGMLELAGVPYVGAGVLASAVGMDKAVQKVLLRAAGLPVVAHEVVTEGEWREDPEAVAARSEALGPPLFVKPAGLGSSVGISKVKAPSDLDPALAEAFSHGRKALIEKAAEGAREIECAVLGNDEPVASVPGEVVAAGEFYDYRSKYLDEGTRLEVPADVPPTVADEVRRMSVAAFRAIDCAGMARVDFFYRPPGEVVVNEINTIPGFTEVSMYPKLWEASGLTYADLVDRLVGLALERHAPESFE